MNNLSGYACKVFDIFENQWALVTAGNFEKFNSCTIGWGSMGTIWANPKRDGSTITIYLYPTRFTTELVMENDYFTVSFFPDSYKKALGYMGLHSGRDVNKAQASGLTPKAIGASVTYAEATTTFLCRKIYQGQLSKEGMSQDVRECYEANPRVYPPVDGEWQPHWMFIGEICDVIHA